MSTDDLTYISIIFISLFIIVSAIRHSNSKLEYLKIRRYDVTQAEAYALAHTCAAVPSDREPLMCFGALMVLRNGGYTRIPFNGRDNSQGLLSDWGIMDDITARKQIYNLISEGRRARFQDDFAKLQAGESLANLKRLDGDDFGRWRIARQVWEDYKLPLEAIQICRSMAAYDYERIGFLARECHHYNFLTTEEMWQCLSWVARQSRQEFSNWAEYAASFVLGRAATYSCTCDDCHAEGVVAVARLLTDEELGAPAGTRHLWQQYPLASIQGPADLNEVVTDNSLLPPQRKQLLGFGALTALFYGESNRDLRVEGLEPGSDVQWLATRWDIADAATTDLRLDWLLTAGSHSEYGSMFSRFVTAEANKTLQDGEASPYIRVRQTQVELFNFGLNTETVRACQTLLAYDLERAAYLVRVALSAGYLDEERAWNYLRRVAMLARKTFNNWEDYLVSFLYGQGFFNNTSSDLERYIKTGINLLWLQSPFREFSSIWQEHPLQYLTVPHSVGGGASIGG